MSMPFDTTTPPGKICDYVVTCFQNSYFDYDKCDCVCFPGFELEYVWFAYECVPKGGSTSSMTPPISTSTTPRDTNTHTTPWTTSTTITGATYSCPQVKCNIDNTYLNLVNCKCECLPGFNMVYLPAWPSYTYKCEPIGSTTPATTGMMTTTVPKSTKACDYFVTCFQNSYFDYDKCDCVCFPGFELEYVSFAYECVPIRPSTTTDRPITTTNTTPPTSIPPCDTKPDSTPAYPQTTNFGTTIYA
jgi:hypothetical protein